MTEKAKKPSIRFKGYHEAWERRKLEETGDSYGGLSGKSKKDFGHGEAKFVPYMNVFSNPIADTDMTESIEADNRQNQVKYGDVFFTTSSETPDEIGMSSVWLKNEDNIYLNSFCFGYRPSEALNSYYLAYMLRSDCIRRKIVFLAQGISRYNISKKKMMEIEVPVPCEAEQRSIGAFFRQLDKLIDLYERKYEKLSAVKKSLLEKMFPADDETAPKIRFKSFTEAWEQCKLCEIANIQKGQQLGKAEMSSIGTYYVLNGGMEASGYTDQYNTPANTISISEGGNSCGYVSLNLEQFWSGGHNYTLQNLKIDTIFLYQWLKRDEKKIMALRVGSGLPNIQKSSLQDVGVVYSTPAEQQAVATFLMKTDNLIALYQSKLEKLGNIKKSLLEKMFV